MFRLWKNKQTSHTTMPQSIKDRWLVALRSGKYKQGTARLHTLATDSYCCLGVLVDCVGEQLEGSNAYPSIDWLNKHDINFKMVVMDANYWKDFDLNLNYGKYKSSHFASASQCNDTHGFSFLQIADMIEAQVKGI